MIENNYHSPLTGWLNKRFALPKTRLLTKNIDGDIEGFLALHIRKELYRVLEIPAQSLSSSWDEFNEYINKAREVINWDDNATLDSDESYYIKKELGDPPECCYPIYIITVGEGTNEELVYIGKTSSNIKRFSGGHRIALELHNPRYNGLDKSIYFATIVFWSSIESNYLPLEWIEPKDKALEILDSIESQLIYYFQPKLNKQKKSRNCMNYSINIHIQNNTDTNFLNDNFIWI